MKHRDGCRETTAENAPSLIRCIFHSRGYSIERLHNFIIRSSLNSNSVKIPLMGNHQSLSELSELI